MQFLDDKLTPRRVLITGLRLMRAKNDNLFTPCVEQIGQLFQYVWYPRTRTSSLSYLIRLSRPFSNNFYSGCSTIGRVSFLRIQLLVFRNRSQFARWKQTKYQQQLRPFKGPLFMPWLWLMTQLVVWRRSISKMRNLYRQYRMQQTRL